MRTRPRGGGRTRSHRPAPRFPQTRDRGGIAFHGGPGSSRPATARIAAELGNGSAGGCGGRVRGGVLAGGGRGAVGHRIDLRSRVQERGAAEGGDADGAEAEGAAQPLEDLLRHATHELWELHGEGRPQDLAQRRGVVRQPRAAWLLRQHTDLPDHEGNVLRRRRPDGDGKGRARLHDGRQGARPTPGTGSAPW